MTKFVFVHGGLHGSWCWEPIAGPLRADGHVVELVDLPGRPGARVGTDVRHTAGSERCHDIVGSRRNLFDTGVLSQLVTTARTKRTSCHDAGDLRRHSAAALEDVSRFRGSLGGSRICPGRRPAAVDTLWTQSGHSHSYLGLDRKRLSVQLRTGSVP